ncbi:MAG: hypothetical protein PHU27_09340 [Salinivirgaceae bacterium]|nr:hypothetical protein [Salinivirgaceae bacterium]MDD4747649.1 hypothetical protein [Salinivirgaceae bacterium]
MKVTGFSFIRNAIKLDYPIVEAITSILPICDNFVVSVGNSDDDTINLIRNIDPSKIRIIETIWDDSLREGGKVLADETNKAFAAIDNDTDWAFYIQGDEVVHEKYLDTIKAAMVKYKDNPKVDGLLLKYKHFYGSYDYVGSSLNWYRNEIRVIKNNKAIYSYRDAQGFRKDDNQKLVVAPIDAYMFHYGWVKDPRAMQEKQETFHKLWHNDQWINDNVVKATEFDYMANVSQLELYRKTHPRVMQKRIESKNWKFEYDISFNKKTLKERTKDFFRKYFGIDISYKNYIIGKKI